MITNTNLAKTLAAYGQAMQVPKAEVIFDAGEIADGVYIIKSGQVHVLLPNDRGIPVWSRNVAEGAILGLPSAVGKYSHCVRAIAVESTELVYVSADTLAELIRNTPTLGTQVLALISEELGDLRRKAKMLNVRIAN